MFPLPSTPLATDIGQIAFERSDTSINNSERVTMDREQFVRFFSEGIFRNDGKTLQLVYKTDHFPKPLNKKGGWRDCSGAFATTGGAVFFWNRPREGVLMISDAQHRTGWLILPEYWDKKASAHLAPKKEQSADKDDVPLE